MSVPYDYDIAIIGDGITGLSAAFHLQKLGFSSVCLFAKNGAASSSAQSAAFVSGGLADNFTRLSHPRGMDLAKSIWNFADHAYDSLMEYVKKAGIPHAEGERERWIISEAEMTEAHKAIEQLNKAGFVGRWKTGLTSPGLLGVQDEGGRAAWVNPSVLLEKLRQETQSQVFGEAQSFQSHGGPIEIQHAGGKVRAEFLICAQHLSIGKLLPNLAEALVPFADQWSEYRLLKANQTLPWSPGSVFSWQHSHIWGVITGKNTVNIGGGRYLRPMAGIEALESSYEPRIVTHLAEAWNRLWPDLQVQATGQGFGLRDCRPCDELPLIGPMFGDSRVLLGTGYMGQGLSLGFTAGRCLAELIAGKPTQVPRLLWPERLRSLPGDTGEDS